MSNDWQYILKLMRAGENEQVKFFGRAVSEQQIGETISAMANTSGGLIVIGIDIVNYHLVGSSVDISWVQKSVLTHLTPLLNIRIDRIKRDEKDLIVVHIPLGANPPYQYNEKTYIRHQTQTRQATTNEEAELKPRSFAKLTAQSHEFWLVHPPEELDKDIEEVEPQAEGTEKEDEHIGTRTPLLVEMVPETPIATFSEPEATLPTAIQPTLSPNITLNSRQKQTISFLKSTGSIKNMEYRNLYQVSHKTAHLELVDLVAHGYIVPQGKGRSTCYVLNAGSQSLTTES